MRKMKKINGYLVVKFNDRELRAWEGTGLGNYGVIDAEFYTGSIGVDRSVMEYDNADSLEEAIELARGLESELDVKEPPTTYTVVKETDDSTEEETVDTQSMIARRETALACQIESDHYPDINPLTARHELYGYMVALKELGMINSDDCFVESCRFEQVDVPGIKPETFAHLPPDKLSSGTARSVYSLGLVLKGDCPENDCRLYLNVFNMCREIDEAINRVRGWPQEVLKIELNRKHTELETMFTMNHAIRQYRKGMQP